ncbi:hypothetical protein DXG01_013086 [Tephrocybe rancida]|nr:hypothetical protein DXG01_013086 [Tephrocybe rancida]
MQRPLPAAQTTLMSTTISFVDDTNPNIIYSNGWNTSGVSDEFNSTTHGTTIAGSQASYTFKGSFIEVFGTIGGENNRDPSFAAISTYTIDNHLDTTVTFTGVIGSINLYNQLFYTSNVLNESQPHTLVITYTTAGKNPLWLDYFRVTDTPINTTTSSAQTTLMPTTVSVVDDTSPKITYSNGWSNGGTSDEFNSTTHGTAIAGSQASYTFKGKFGNIDLDDSRRSLICALPGSFIEVFGTIGRENNGDPSFAAISTYMIDNNPDTLVTFTGAIGSINLYKQLLYASSVLDENQLHTLIITYTTAGKNPLWLDYFQVTDTPIITTTSSTQTTLLPTTTSSAQVTLLPTTTSSAQTTLLSTATSSAQTTLLLTTTSSAQITLLPTTVSVVDDTSPDITYSNGWSKSGVSDEFNSTTHGTAIVGSQASYTFKGSVIEVFGTIGRENNGDPSFAAISNYTIDNNLDTAVTFTGVIGSTNLHKQLFYSSNVLDGGQWHTLVITYMTAGRNPLWLDYFRVNDTPITTTATSSTASIPTAQPSPTTSSQSSRLSPGAIGGIVVGSCAALFLAVVIVLLLRGLYTRGSRSHDKVPQARRSTSWLGA